MLEVYGTTVATLLRNLVLAVRWYDCKTGSRPAQLKLWPRMMPMRLRRRIIELSDAYLQKLRGIGT